MRAGIMLCKHVVDELAAIAFTLKELGVTTTEAKEAGILSKREELLFGMLEKQKTHPIDHSLVFG